MEDLAHRAPALDRGRAPPGDRQVRRTRRLLIGRPLLHRLREPGDPDHPGDGRDGRHVLGDADLVLHRRPPGHPDLLLRADDPRLPVGGRRLHRRPRQPRRVRRPGRRGRAADGLHPHGVRLDLVRSRPDHLGLPRPLRASRDPGGLPGRLRDVHQPARRQGVGPRLRVAHLLLRRDDVRHGGCGPLAASRGVAPSAGRPAASRDRDHSLVRAVPAAARVLERHHGGHGRRGDLERHPGLQAAPQSQRGCHSHVDVRHPGLAVPRHQLSVECHRGCALGARDRHLAARPRRLRGPRRALPRRARRHHPDPGDGGQHRLRRLPASGRPAGGGWLPAAPAHLPRQPSRLLQGHPRAGGDRLAADLDLPGERHRADSPLRDRRLSLLHPVPVRHGQEMAEVRQARRGRGDPGTRLRAASRPALALQDDRQRHRRRDHGRR